MCVKNVMALPIHLILDKEEGKCDLNFDSTKFIKSMMTTNGFSHLSIGPQYEKESREQDKKTLLTVTWTLKLIYGSIMISTMPPGYFSMENSELNINSL